uniref:SRCR domain-containing protein n=1 Tax=Terrapene triunguis TaxID=2587831 RepID=A0A674JGN7_9SAUR
ISRDDARNERSPLVKLTSSKSKQMLLCTVRHLPMELTAAGSHLCMGRPAKTERKYQNTPLVNMTKKKQQKGIPGPLSQAMWVSYVPWCREGVTVRNNPLLFVLLPGPPRLNLVDGRFHCSGIVELYMGGHSGTVQSSPENEMELARWVCPKVGCGDALEWKEWPFFMKNESQRLPVHWEMVASCRTGSFRHPLAMESHQSLLVSSPGFQPRIMQSLGDSQSPCEGVMEVFHKGKWEVLCDSSPWRKSRGQQVCQELQCGNLSLSVQVQGAKTRGVSCSQEHLQQCPTFQRTTCQNFKPRSAGVGAGTIVSILLALILLGVLIVICVRPLILLPLDMLWYDSLISFHRNSTVTLRPRQEGQGAQGEDNDYSQTPKKNSYLSAYPALEGAIRSSNPPDNSSDSDYDLHSARRL